MNTRATFFPFDLFGSPGTKLGAERLADAFEEMLSDNAREKVSTRARAYAGKIRFEEVTFETLADYGDWKPQARARVSRALQKNEFLLWVSGNHLGVLPVYEELAKSERPTLVLQLDAHLDIYNLGDCTPELSHGNFLLHAEDGLPPIVNVGHRELLLRVDHIAKYYQSAVSGMEWSIDSVQAFATLRSACADADRIFIDIDCDVFDPAFFPAVAEPRPFGISPAVVLQLLEFIGRKRLVGLAVSEYDPARDVNDGCLATLIWLLEYVLLWKYEG